jgi:hypothetical protein
MERIDVSFFSAIAFMTAGCGAGASLPATLPDDGSSSDAASEIALDAAIDDSVLSPEAAEEADPGFCSDPAGYYLELRGDAGQLRFPFGCVVSGDDAFTGASGGRTYLGEGSRSYLGVCGCQKLNSDTPSLCVLGLGLMAAGSTQSGLATYRDATGNTFTSSSPGDVTMAVTSYEAIGRPIDGSYTAGVRDPGGGIAFTFSGLFHVCHTRDLSPPP